MFLEYATYFHCYYTPPLPGPSQKLSDDLFFFYSYQSGSVVPSKWGPRGKWYNCPLPEDGPDHRHHHKRNPLSVRRDYNRRLRLFISGLFLDIPVSPLTPIRASDKGTGTEKMLFWSLNPGLKYNRPAPTSAGRALTGRSKFTYRYTILIIMYFLVKSNINTPPLVKTL